jgi:transcriptional regulator GlxA family with amidase domain
MQPIASNSSGARRIVIFAPPLADELDIIGPAEVFSIANHIRMRFCRNPGYALELVTSAADRVIRGEAGITLQAHQFCRHIRGRIDTLLVAGGTAAVQFRDAAALNWLRGAAAKARRVASVCTGAFLLGEAGLLRGRRVTTHWFFAEALARRFPEAKVDADPIWVRDGNIYTAAGVTCGIDLTLELVEEDFGARLALEVSRELVVFLRRSGNQAQFSSTLVGQAAERKPLRELQVWIAENLRQALPLQVLAQKSGMSLRTFCRRFKEEVGQTPAQYVDRIRVETACRKLEQSEQSLAEIAWECGFRSVDVMRVTFARLFQTTPGAYRRSFRTGCARVEQPRRARAIMTL